MQDEHTRRACLLYGGLFAVAAAWPGRVHAAEVTAWPRGVPVPDLTAPDLAGVRWSLAAQRGKAVLLNFWASWCEPCRAEMPALQTLAQFYGPDKLTVLALNFKESPVVAERFARRTGLTLPILLDPTGDHARRWAVKVFPTTVLIGADGVARWRVRGEMDWTSPEAARLVDSLVA